METAFDQAHVVQAYRDAIASEVVARNDIAQTEVGLILGPVCGLAKMHLVLFMPLFVSPLGRSMQCLACAYQVQCEIVQR